MGGTSSSSELPPPCLPPCLPACLPAPLKACLPPCLPPTLLRPLTSTPPHPVQALLAHVWPLQEADPGVGGAGPPLQGKPTLKGGWRGVCVGGGGGSSGHAPGLRLPLALVLLPLLLLIVRPVDAAGRWRREHCKAGCYSKRHPCPRGPGVEGRGWGWRCWLVGGWVGSRARQLSSRGGARPGRSGQERAPPSAADGRAATHSLSPSPPTPPAQALSNPGSLHQERHG